MKEVVRANNIIDSCTIPEFTNECLVKVKITSGSYRSAAASGYSALAWRLAFTRYGFTSSLCARIHQKSFPLLHPRCPRLRPRSSAPPGVKG